MQTVQQVIQAARLVPVIKIPSLEEDAPILHALYAGGFRVAEITYRTACAGAAIRMARASFPDLVVGAGTVINLEQAEEACACGAAFLVSPGFCPKISAFCKERGIAYFGGAVTPTEIMQAIAAGETIIKFFPAELSGGCAALKTYAAVFPGVRFMPTGGVSPANLKSYLALPNVAAAGGSWMVSDADITGKNYAAIEQKCAEANALLATL